MLRKNDVASVHHPRQHLAERLHLVAVSFSDQSFDLIFPCDDHTILFPLVSADSIVLNLWPASRAN